MEATTPKWYFSAKLKLDGFWSNQNILYIRKTRKIRGIRIWKPIFHICTGLFANHNIFIEIFSMNDKSVDLGSGSFPLDKKCNEMVCKNVWQIWKPYPACWNPNLNESKNIFVAGKNVQNIEIFIVTIPVYVFHWYWLAESVPISTYSWGKL